MVKYGCVYRLTNIVNNKKYIGETVNFTRRMSEHKRRKKYSPLGKAIQKYGWNAFKPEIVIDGITEEDLRNLEDYYIDAENTLIPNGYNVRKSRGNVTFDKDFQKWEAYGPNRKHIGYYLTREKAKQALKLYKSTGERMESDKCTRKKGTGTIGKRGKRYEAQIAINKKRYSKMFDTVEQCEAWFKSRSNN